MAVRHVSGPRLDPTGPIPACGLPEPEEIGRACEPKRPRSAGGYAGLRVTGASCRFTDARRSRATCTFSLTEIPPLRRATAPPPEQIRESFMHRFDEVHEADASGYGAYWYPVGRCRTPA